MNNPSTKVDMMPTNLWQKALDHSPSGILVYELEKQGPDTSPQFLIQLANKQAEKMLGYTREELVGRFAHDLFPRSAGHVLWTDIERAITSKTGSKRDLFYHIARSGMAAWFSVTIDPIADSRCAVVSFVDITEWKQAQQHLLEDSILFKALSSTVPEMGVVAVDFFRKVALANGRIPGLFRSSNPDDLIGRRFVDAIEQEFMGDWETYIRTAFDGEQHYFTDHWGGWRWEVYVGPVRNANGQIVMVLVVYKNVSEQYQQQQALQQANVSLHRSNEDLERFAYVASHDLQEPLRKIRSFGDLLKARYADQLDGMGVDLVDRMQSGANRMDELIRSILAFSRVNSTPLAPATVILEDLFNGIQADLEMVIQEKKAIITVQPPLPMVPGDEAQLRQLFQNLITNALKFMSPGAEPRITISARIVSGTDVGDHPPAGRDPQTQYAEISVADNGIGIAKENFEKIFKLFTRLHGRTAYAGTGIGLATTKRVAENHGGTILVDSEEGRGTTFRVYLPVKSS